MSSQDKALVLLRGEIKTPPMSKAARLEAESLLRRLQQSEVLSMPHSRPMPDIGRRCQELRIEDGDSIWRVFYRTDPDAVLILGVLQKKSRTTPQEVIDSCKGRLAAYDTI